MRDLNLIKSILSIDCNKNIKITLLILTINCIKYSYSFFT